jgi:hypothetical protein
MCDGTEQRRRRKKKTKEENNQLPIIITLHSINAV